MEKGATKVLDKIKHLFKLAENNNSEEEAQSALKMARKLLQEHGLTMMDLDMEDHREDLTGECQLSLDGKKKLPIWILTLGDIVAQYFEVGFCHQNRRFTHSLFFFGNKVNAQAATVTLPSLVNQIESMAKAYRHPDMEAKVASWTKKLRESYILGLLHGFTINYVIMKREQEECPQITALAIRNEDLQAEWLTNQGIKLKTIRRPLRTVQETAYEDGKLDSRKLSLNPSLNS